MNRAPSGIGGRVPPAPLNGANKRCDAYPMAYPRRCVLVAGHPPPCVPYSGPGAEANALDCVVRDASPTPMPPTEPAPQSVENGSGHPATSGFMVPVERGDVGLKLELERMLSARDATICAWLRSMCRSLPPRHDLYTLRIIAEKIDRGEHLEPIL